MLGGIVLASLLICQGYFAFAIVDRWLRITQYERKRNWRMGRPRP